MGASFPVPCIPGTVAGLARQSFQTTGTIWKLLELPSLGPGCPAQVSGQTLLHIICKARLGKDLFEARSSLGFGAPHSHISALPLWLRLSCFLFFLFFLSLIHLDGCGYVRTLSLLIGPSPACSSPSHSHRLLRLLQQHLL